MNIYSELCVIMLKRETRERQRMTGGEVCVLFVGNFWGKAPLIRWHLSIEQQWRRKGAGLRVVQTGKQNCRDLTAGYVWRTALGTESQNEMRATVSGEIREIEARLGETLETMVSILMLFWGRLKASEGLKRRPSTVWTLFNFYILFKGMRLYLLRNSHSSPVKLVYYYH